MAQKNLLNLVHGTLEQGTVMAMSTATPVVEALEMVQIQGNAYSYNVVKDVIATGHRELGEDVTPSELQTEKKTIGLKILTNSVKTDRALGVMQDINDIQAESQNLAMISSGLQLEKEVLKRLDEEVEQSIGKKFTGALTMDLIDDALDYVRGIREGKGIIFVSPKVKRELSKLMKDEGYKSANEEAFGRKATIYDNVPIITSENIEGDKIYVVKFGMDAVHGITNGGVKTYNYDKGVHVVTDTELLYNVIAKTDKAFAIIEPTLARTLKNK